MRILYLGLVLLAAVTVLFAVRQMLIVFVHAGQRKAIEEFAETNGILPRGVFSWENGPARELSDARRLDGRINPARYIEPGLAGILHAGVSTYGLGRLQTFGVLSAWFIAPLALAVFGLVMVLSAFWYIPATMERVYSWTRGELAKKADTD